MVEYAQNFTLLQVRDRTSLVASMVAHDPSGLNHLMSGVISKTMFGFSGCIPNGKLTYSLLNIRVASPLPKPILVADEMSYLLHHDSCSWDTVRDLVELCAGMGGMGQGLMNVGFRPVLACDQNPLMLDLYRTQSNVATVCGDISNPAVVHALWEKHPFSSTMGSGVSCQPYSALGDRGSGNDPRAQSLPGTLACTHFLRSVLIFIECVSPAQQDTFVTTHIQRFCRLTGFHFTDEF